jgi:cob(I)alamin adenosyltransferase
LKRRNEDPRASGTPGDERGELAKLRKLEPAQRVGLVIVITGHGKGKTTAAFGMALRAVGHAMKVCVIQFVKGDMFSGEMEAIRRLTPEIELHLTGKGFCGIMGDRHTPEEHRESAQNALGLARWKMASGEFDVIILDEINNALKLKLLDLAQMIELIEAKPPLMHLILTGRDAAPEVIERAHMVTEVREVKHPCRQGIGPQKGVDF